MRRVLKVIGVAVLIALLVPLAQWVEYERAYRMVEALPCNGTFAPYRVEIRSFLPPWGTLQNAVGHRWGYDGLEVVVPEKLEGSERSWWYNITLDDASSSLNSSVRDLREMLANDTGKDYVEEAFYSVSIDYFTLKFSQEYGEKNLTEVVFKPSPPLSWLLKGEAFISMFKEPAENVLMAFLLSGVIFALILLWFYILGNVLQRLKIRSAFLKGALALILLILIVFPAARVIVWVGEMGKENGNSTTWTGGTHSCRRTGPTYDDFWSMAVDYIHSHGDTSYCEVLNYLRGVLTEGEFKNLTDVVSDYCLGTTRMEVSNGG